MAFTSQRSILEWVSDRLSVVPPTSWKRRLYLDHLMCLCGIAFARAYRLTLGLSIELDDEVICAMSFDMLEIS